MTAAEEKKIIELKALLNEIRIENQRFSEDITNQVKVINIKVDQKHLPITLEQDILKTTQLAINDAISKVLVSYDGSLMKLTKSVIDENSAELRTIISNSFVTVIRTEDFKKSIINAFSHKVARTVISNNDGLFDRVSNELKQDSVFKAKMALAVATVVEECLIKK